MTLNRTSYKETWSDEWKKRLAELIKTNSFSQVAKLFNEEFGTTFSRNAMIGKAHRLGLCQPARRDYVRAESRKVAKPVTMKSKQSLLRNDNDRGRRHQQRSFIPHKPGTVPVLPEAFPDTARPLLDAEPAICRWPTSGVAAALQVCGAAVEIGSYCEHHAQLAYSVMPTKKRNVIFRASEVLLLEYSDD